MNSRHFTKVIIDVAIFLEFTGEDLLNSDSAIGVMEQISSELRRMPKQERQIFADQCRELSDTYGEKKDFVMSLPETLGVE